ncbi:hypothetical protein HDU85_006842 [Gaertneriomyces sp. JEL0708]|nr:hypothetical protein HDU85_006842 [Gaertneriomyces sp. JEL0708]
MLDREDAQVRSYIWSRIRQNTFSVTQFFKWMDYTYEEREQAELALTERLQDGLAKAVKSTRDHKVRDRLPARVETILRGLRSQVYDNFWATKRQESHAEVASGALLDWTSVARKRRLAEYERSTKEREGTVDGPMNAKKLRIHEQNCLSENREGTENDESTPPLASFIDDNGQAGTISAPIPSDTLFSKDHQEYLDLRDTVPIPIKDTRKWARACPTVEDYVKKAISYMQHSDIRLQQRGRHLLRFIRNAGILDHRLLDTLRPAAKWQGCREYESQVYAYDVDYLRRSFNDQPSILAAIHDMKQKNFIVSNSSWRTWLSRWRPHVPSAMSKAATISLIELAAKIDKSRTDITEQDVRLVWAAATRAATPVQNNAVDVSLEFSHMWEGDDGRDENLTKSDITIAVRGEWMRVGGWIAEVEKTDVGAIGRGRVHKDWLKAAGETAQQIISFLSATEVETTQVKDLAFHYALVAKWRMQSYVLRIEEVDDMYWFVRYTGPAFEIGPDASGLAGILAFGEYLNATVLPACSCLEQMLTVQRDALLDVVSRLPILSTEPFKSRFSSALVTPAKKRRPCNL